MDELLLESVEFEGLGLALPMHLPLDAAHLLQTFLFLLFACLLLSELLHALSLLVRAIVVARVVIIRQSVQHLLLSLDLLLNDFLLALRFVGLRVKLLLLAIEISRKQILHVRVGLAVVEGVTLADRVLHGVTILLGDPAKLSRL